MFPIDMANSFNFSPSSLSPHITDPFLPSGNDCTDDSLFTSPLLNNTLGFWGTQGYLSSCMIHRCNVLKCNLIQVTAEHDTIKNLFNQLASTVKSLSVPSILDVDPCLQEMSKDKKTLTCETHKHVHFWMRKNYNDWMNSPEAQCSNHGPYASEVLKADKLVNIWKAL
ncbi:hypothetical protein V8B97DRAFT_2026202 [Scleroderma yunnanense]